MPINCAIRIDHLSFTYAGETQPALHDISLAVTTGSCFGLLGPNGAGKSTLLSLLTGLLPLQQGNLQIYDTALNSNNLAQHTDLLRNTISLVPQDYAFYPTLTVQENLECFAGLYHLSGQNKQRAIEFAVQFCGLQDTLHRRAAACSGGVRRRLNLALGLLNQPKILFLDEPTVGIDAQSRHFIMQSIASLQQQGITIIYTSHYMEEIQTICDAVAIIDHGKLLLQDTLTNVMAQAASLPLPSAQQNAKRLEDYYLSLTRPQLRD